VYPPLLFVQLFDKMTSDTDIKSSHSNTGIPIIKRKEKSIAVKTYLFTYNMIHTLGWGWVVLWISWSFLTCGMSCMSQIYAATERMVIFLQVLVFVDLFHDYFELVSPPDMNILVRIHCKVVRRAHIYFVALYFIPEVQQHYATALMLFLWGSLDLIRYPFYALNTWRACPSWLYWLRYSEFMVLYPIGFVSEIWIWFLMFPYMREKQLHSWQWETFPLIQFNYFYFACLYVLYRFCTFPVNYLRLLRMRSKRLQNTRMVGTCG